MTRMSDYGITVLRVTLGIIFVMHGYLAGFVFTPKGLANFNDSLGIPLPAITAWFIILGHGLGGLSLVLGFLTRVGALVHVVIMGGAVFFVHLRQGFFLQGFEGGRVGGSEYAVVLLMASIAMVFLGSGPLGLDRPRR